MSQHRFLAAVAVGLLATQSGSMMLAPLLVAIAVQFDTSMAVTGQLATVTFAAWAVSVVSVGPLSDSLGRRRVALTGLALLSISVLASAFAPNFGVLMALRAVTSLGGGMIPPNSLAAVADSLPPARRAQAVGGLMAFSTLSTVIGVPLVAVVANAGGWQVPFLVIGGMLAACLVLNWFWFPKGDSSGPPSFSYFSRYRTLLAIPAFRSAIGVNFAQRMAYFALFSDLAAYLIEAYDLSVGSVALPMALVGIGSVVGTYIGGPVANHSQRMPLIGVAALAGGATALLLFLIEVPFWGAVAIATGAVSLLSVGWPVLLTFSTEISGQSGPRGLACLALAISQVASAALLWVAYCWPLVGFPAWNIDLGERQPFLL